MSEDSKSFNCCVQCRVFWGCKTLLDSLEKENRPRCCPSCSNFEVCKIIIDKIKVKLAAPPDKAA